MKRNLKNILKVDASDQDFEFGTLLNDHGEVLGLVLACLSVVLLFSH